MHIDGEPAWLERARFYLQKGVRETPSRETDNPDIAHFHRFTVAGVPEHPDEVHWCSSFVNCCLIESGEKGTRSKSARTWLEYGHEIHVPQLGCIAVYEREGGYHVGFVVGVATNGDLELLGGNQGNAVSIRRRSSEHLLSLRMPGEAA